MKNNGIRKGFTIIELLIVTAIIVTIATLVVVNFNTNRMKSRNAQRMSDIRAIQLALELYYDDNGEFPTCNTSWFCSSTGAGGGTNQWINHLLVPKYLPKMPVDPLNKSGEFAYFYAQGCHIGSTQTTWVCPADRPNRTWDYVLGTVIEGEPGTFTSAGWDVGTNVINFMIDPNQ